MNVNMPLLRIIYCLMEVHFLSLGSKRRPWEVCPSDREQVAVPVMAPDFATEVQGKNYTNSEGFTMSILYRWKRLQVYFHMQQPAHPLKLFAELCLFWWRLFQSHVVQTGPIWLPTSRWILYHSIRFYPMYYTWMESLSSLLSYATNGTSIEVVWRELCPFSWRLFGNNVVRTGPIWAR